MCLRRWGPRCKYECGTASSSSKAPSRVRKVAPWSAEVVLPVPKSPKFVAIDSWGKKSVQGHARVRAGRGDRHEQDEGAPTLLALHRACMSGARTLFCSEQRSPERQGQERVSAARDAALSADNWPYRRSAAA